MKHDVRLDVLCCLVDGEPLTDLQLSARTGKSLPVVVHHLRLLDSFDLIEKDEGPEGGKPLYVAALDGHPDWVREAVEAHCHPG